MRDAFKVLAAGKLVVAVRKQGSERPLPIALHFQSAFYGADDCLG